MNLFTELKRRNVFREGIAGMPEQDGPSVGRLHVTAQTRGPASLLRSPSLQATARVGTSLYQGRICR